MNNKGLSNPKIAITLFIFLTLAGLLGMKWYHYKLEMREFFGGHSEEEFFRMLEADENDILVKRRKEMLRDHKGF